MCTSTCSNHDTKELRVLAGKDNVFEQRPGAGGGAILGKEFVEQNSLAEKLQKLNRGEPGRQKRYCSIIVAVYALCCCFPYIVHCRRQL